MTALAIYNYYRAIYITHNYIASYDCSNIDNGYSYIFITVLAIYNQFQLPSSKKKGIVRCLQYQLKAISSDADAYQEEMISLRHNFHHNNYYPESIISALRKLDRRIEDDTRNLTTVCMTYVKGLAEKIQKICSPYDIRTIFTSGSTLRRYLLKSQEDANRIQHDQELCVLHPLLLW